MTVCFGSEISRAKAATPNMTPIVWGAETTLQQLLTAPVKKVFHFGISFVAMFTELFKHTLKNRTLCCPLRRSKKPLYQMDVHIVVTTDDVYCSILPRGIRTLEFVDLPLARSR
jgi:hypothetical protein